MVAVERRGKYLIVRFESGRVLLVHLRMTGSFRYSPAGSLDEDPYRRAVVSLDDGSDVGYRDVRRFGTWLLVEPGELDPYLARRLGVEPFARAFTARALGERLAGRRAPIKAALLDQRSLAGHREHLRRRGALARANPSRFGPHASSTPARCDGSTARSGRRSRRASRARARPSATTRRPMGARARCRTSSASTGATDAPASAAARRSRRRARAVAARGSAHAARALEGFRKERSHSVVTPRSDCARTGSRHGAHSAPASLRQSRGTS